MYELESIDKNDKIFCTKCGWENPSDARYCANCGFFLTRPDDIESSYDAKKSKKGIKRPGKKSDSMDRGDERIRCPRCGNDIRNLSECALCGLRAPEPSDMPDEFFVEFMTRFPRLLVNPESFVDCQPYSLGWISLIRPVLWTTLFAIISWVLMIVMIGGGLKKDLVPDMSWGVFLLMSMALIVLVVPWLVLLYTALIQLAALLVGGRGQIERTCKALCTMLCGLFLILAMLLVIHNFAKTLILMDPQFLLDSKWREDFLKIPLILKLIIFFVQFYFLHLQIRLISRINFIDLWKSFLAHVILIVPVLVYVILRYYHYI